MRTSKSVRARKRFAGFAAITTLLVAGVGIMQAQADSVPQGSIGGFEDDGNMVEEPAVTGTIDWDNINPIVVVDDNDDSGYQGKSKENDPSGFVCNNGGGSPPKDNILRAYINPRVTSNSAFLDLGFVRSKGQGDTNITFELDKNEITNPCPYTGRTDNDLLLMFNFPGGAGDAEVTAFKWDSSISSDGEWVGISLPADSAAAGSNPDDLTDAITGDEVCARCFGEATLDLNKINDALGGGFTDCPGAGFANIRSRSSGESLRSALQDRLPQTPIDLSTCGKVKLLKHDDSGNPLAGATFGLFDNAQASGNPLFTCVSGANGVCTMNNVPAGDYFVAETQAPAGYDPDPTIVPVHVDKLSTTDITANPFIDVQRVGAIQITKDGPDLVHVGDTITYTMKVTNTDPDSDVTEVSVTDPICDANTLERTSNGDGNEILAPGEEWNYQCTHVVTAQDPDPLPNTATVNGTSEGQPVTDDDDHLVDVIHPAITIDKTVDPTSANAGDTVTYSYKVTNTGDVTLTNVKVTDDILGDIGTIASLAPNATQTLTKDVVIAADSATHNVGTVTGDDPLGTEVTDDDPADLVIVAPEVITPPDQVLPLELPRTGGFPADRMAVVAIALIGFGIVFWAASFPVTAIASLGRKHRK